LLEEVEIIFAAEFNFLNILIHNIFELTHSVKAETQAWEGVANKIKMVDLSMADETLYSSSQNEFQENIVVKIGRIRL
jgi:fructose-specific phosphotransferase system component IIB